MICSGETVTYRAGPDIVGYTYRFVIDGDTKQEGANNEFTTDEILADNTVEVVDINDSGCEDTATIDMLVPELTDGGGIEFTAAGAVEVTICVGADTPAIGVDGAAAADGAFCCCCFVAASIQAT